MLSEKGLQIFIVNISIIPIVDGVECLDIVELFVALKDLLGLFEDPVVVDFQFYELGQFSFNSWIKMAGTS